MSFRAIARARSIALWVAWSAASSFTALASPVQAGESAALPQLPAELVKVRAALDKYRDPVVAVHDGYFSTLGCVHYPKAAAAGQVPTYTHAGSMGVHFLNGTLISTELDPMVPQVLIYEPDGEKLRLVAAEWFVPLSTGVKERPELFGQKFDGPMAGHHPLMPTALTHYDLHVWLWKENPAGLFSPTNPDVKCPQGPYNFPEPVPNVVPATG
ncbi:MAG TPA: hypothetical protein VHR17_02795 [Thermoanaerobaculia bacterium]|nr:hypothetical protein [Thermoanaerobaculia bacterium]